LPNIDRLTETSFVRLAGERAAKQEANPLGKIGIIIQRKQKLAAGLQDACKFPDRTIHVSSSFYLNQPSGSCKDLSEMTMGFFHET